MLHRCQSIALFWFAALLLLAASCICVDARSNFLPFFSNKPRGGKLAPDPSLAPANDPSRKIKRKIKRRTKSSDSSPAVESPQSETESHVHKKRKRKRKSKKVKGSTTSKIEEETVKKRSISTKEGRDTSKRPHKGSPSIKKKKRKKRSSSKTVIKRDETYVERTPQIAVEKTASKPEKKKRKQKKTNSRDLTTSSKQPKQKVVQPEPTRKKRKLRKRTTNVKNPVAPPTPVVDSQAHFDSQRDTHENVASDQGGKIVENHSKKKKRVRKRRRGAVLSGMVKEAASMMDAARSALADELDAPSIDRSNESVDDAILRDNDSPATETKIVENTYVPGVAIQQGIEPGNGDDVVALHSVVTETSQCEENVGTSPTSQADEEVDEDASDIPDLSSSRTDDTMTTTESTEKLAEEAGIAVSITCADDVKIEGVCDDSTARADVDESADQKVSVEDGEESADEISISCSANVEIEGVCENSPPGHDIDKLLVDDCDDGMVQDEDKQFNNETVGQDIAETEFEEPAVDRYNATIDTEMPATDRDRETDLPVEENDGEDQQDTSDTVPQVPDEANASDENEEETQNAAPVVSSETENSDEEEEMQNAVPFVSLETESSDEEEESQNAFPDVSSDIAQSEEKEDSHGAGPAFSSGVIGNEETMDEYQPNELSKVEEQEGEGDEVSPTEDVFVVENSDSKVNLKAAELDDSSSDVSETGDISMEEYEPALLEKSGEQAASFDEETEKEDPSVDDAIVEEEKDMETEPDVIRFIEDFLQEDVRSWVYEVSSDVNGTRGGHQDDSGDGYEEPKDAAEKADDEKENADKENNSDITVVDEGEKDIDDDSKEATSQTSVVSESSKEDDSAASAFTDNTSTTDEKSENLDGNAIPKPKEKVQNVPLGKKTSATEGVAKIPLDLSSLESSEDSDSDICVSVVTWNLAESSPSEDDAAFIRKFRKSGFKKGSGSDLVLISGQECENIKPRRSEGSRSREYRRLMIKMLGKQYVPIALHLLGGIQFGLFAKRSFLKDIEDISVADVTCGIGNVFHNKGAIAAFVKVKARNPAGDNKSKALRMVFVTAHLAAHVKNTDARDSDFWRISSELEDQAPEGFLPRRRSDPSEDTNDSFLFNNVDRVFFCGDLNYRIDLPREVTEYTIRENDGDEKDRAYSELMRHDQLKRTIAQGRAFPGFAEGKIAFAPTFKFDKDSSSYDTSHKQRIPAWTDRILFKPDGTRVMTYDSVPDAHHSDHRPVFGTYRVSMEGKELPSRTRSGKGKPKSRRNHSRDSN